MKEQRPSQKHRIYVQKFANRRIYHFLLGFGHICKAIFDYFA